MNLEKIEGINYFQMYKVFGEPQRKDYITDDILKLVEWRITGFSVPFIFQMDSEAWAQRNFTNKEKYKIPSVENEDVDLINVIGRREASLSIVIPLLRYTFGLDFDGKKNFSIHLRGVDFNQVYNHAIGTFSKNDWGATQ